MKIVETSHGSKKMDENASVSVSWEGKTVQHSMHVGDYIEKINLQ